MNNMWVDCEKVLFASLIESLPPPCKRQIVEWLQAGWTPHDIERRVNRSRACKLSEIAVFRFAEHMQRTARAQTMPVEGGGL
jgi:hypothetical protein